MGWLRQIAGFLGAATLALGQNVPTGLKYKGVNLAGAEFSLDEGGGGKLGTQGVNYWWPAPYLGYNGAGYFISKGMNFFRIPFRWERLQPVKGGALNEAEVSRLTQTVNSLLAYPGVTVYLDMHNYGRYLAPAGSGATRNNQVAVIGEGPHTSIAQFADGWARIASLFKGNMRVIFAIMNEVHDADMPTYYTACQAAINKIRATGATNYLAMMGGGWGSASWYGTSEADADVMFNSVKDPNGKLLYEGHLYMDDAGGNSGLCNGNTIGRTKAAMMTAWLRKHNAVGVIAEFSVGYGAVCQQALDNVLNHLEANSDVWMGWAYWAGGVPFSNNMNSFWTLEPLHGGDREAMNTLEPHLKWKVGNPTTDLNPVPNGCTTQQYNQCYGNNTYTGPTCCPTGFWCQIKSANWGDCKIGSKPGAPVPAPVIAPVPPAPGSCSNVYFSPCGGQGFTGVKCCPSGSYCKAANQWYSDCQPGTAPVSTCSNTLTSQCGGQGFNGKKCCPTGMTCTVQNSWYSDCQKSTSPSPTTPGSTASPAVTSLALYDSGTGTNIAIKNPLTSGAVINLRDLPSGQVIIRAATSPSTVGSVKFVTDYNVNNVDSSAPYDSGSHPFAAAGSYTITATPYSASAAGGSKGTALARTFSFVTVSVDANQMKLVSGSNVASATLGPKYTKFDLYKNWQDAKTYCASKGGKLAMPKTSSDYLTLKRFLPATNTNVWIGVQKVSGVLKFVDGTTVTTKYWNSGEGGVSSEQCVAAVSSGSNQRLFGKWADAGCGGVYIPFVCQK